jgi:acetyl esterase/lipase
MYSRLNEPYGDHPRQAADIYNPRSSGNGTVIIFWHGGSWQRGDKATYAFIGRRLSRLGYTTVVPNYRLYPEVSWPTFAEDAALVVAWVHRELLPKRLVVMGHSAGGQIAAAIAFDPEYLATAGVSGAISGFIGLSGAYTFTPARSLKPVLEADKPWQTPQLVTDCPVPSLLVHGLIDVIVPVRASKQLANRLVDAGGRVETAYYRHLNHFTVLIPFVIGWWFLPSLKRKFVDFINSL